VKTKKTRRKRGPSLATVLQADFRRIAAGAHQAIERRVTRLVRQTRALRRASLDQRRGIARLERGVSRLRDLDSGFNRRSAGGPGVKPSEIRALRARMGMTREKFARYLGVSPGSIFLWETGRAQPRAGSAARLRQAGAGRPARPSRRRGARGR
jgi:DNA-binding transcriptional regulator YiaG